MFFYILWSHFSFSSLIWFVLFIHQGRGPLCICSQSEPEFSAEEREEAGEE